MAAVRRMASMAGLAVWRTYRTPNILVWILGMPLLLSFLVSSFLAQADDPSARSPWIAFEAPGGEVDPVGLSRLGGAFGVYLVFSLAALIAQAGTIHDEAEEGRLRRIVALGIPYREIVAAHLVSIGLIGLIQAGLIVAITWALGLPWFARGWAAILPPFLASIFACAGMAVAVAGLVRDAGMRQAISGGAPSLLALLGGAFFPLDVAPANVQRLATVNPFYWSMEALDGGLAYQGWASQAGPVAVLILVGVLGLVVGGQALRRLHS